MMFASRQQRLLLTLLVASYLGAVVGGPIQNEERLLARQVTASTEATVTQTATQATTTVQTTSRSSATSTATSSVATSSAVSTTASVTTTVVTVQSSTSIQTTSAQTTSIQTTSHTSTITSDTSSSSSTTTSSSTTSASATSTASSNIFSKSSPYFGYAIGVTVVVAVFGSLLLVLLIRWLVQKFSKKPNQPVIASNADAWRYSQDTELYSPGAAPDSANNTVSTAPLSRHKGVRPEMGEAQAFLSTESVVLYPPTKYKDEESDPRRHSRSLSNASSQATTTPYIQRRPMSFLQSPPATHPAFIVDRDQESSGGHGHSDAVELKAVPEGPKDGQPSGTTPGPSMAGLLLTRAGHSDVYRQSTVGSATWLSRAASTASAYSQPSGVYTPPPMPELPPPPMPVPPQAQVQPRPQSRDLSPDVAAALSTMQTNLSTDTIPEDGLVHHEDNHATLRPTPGRMGWGRQAPSSVHSNSDLFFGHGQR